MSRMRSHILVITTGGTIDAEPYESTPEDVTVRKDSLIPQACAEMGIEEGLDFFHWLQKDSKKISAQDLEDLANIIRSDDHQCFLITHGTDAMPENSRGLQTLLRDSGKKVIITGAMTPLSHGINHSDGYRNLEVAVTALRHPEFLSDNVSVVMGGKRWRTEGLAKDFEKKEFYYEKKTFVERTKVAQDAGGISKL